MNGEIASRSCMLKRVVHFRDGRCVALTTADFAYCLDVRQLHYYLEI